MLNGNICILWACRKLVKHSLPEKQYAVQNDYFFESSPLKCLSTSSRLSGFLALVNTTE
jgi:hypothetical protein